MPKTSLLIEDHKDIREGTAELLELEGYHVISVQNGLEGIAAARLNIPDLIICDILMPEIDGYGVFRRLLAEESTSHIPFIFFTSKSETADKDKAQEIGHCSYLVKPFNETDLLNNISSMLGKPGIP